MERKVDTFEQVMDAIAAVSALSSGRGRPTLDIYRDDGSSLGLSSDGLPAFLVWTDALGDAYHSVGGEYLKDLVFDYFGSWSEGPAEQLVRFDDAVECVASFVESGSPVTDSVLFTPE